MFIGFFFFFIPSTGLSGQRVCCSTVFALNWRKKGENEKHGETWERQERLEKGQAFSQENIYLGKKALFERKQQNVLLKLAT